VAVADGTADGETENAAEGSAVGAAVGSWDGSAVGVDFNCSPVSKWLNQNVNNRVPAEGIS
jgi:hypothetical protein